MPAFEPATDFWRVPLGAGAAGWEKLPKPGSSGGPPPSGRGEPLVCAAGDELVVLSGGKLWALHTPTLTWRCVRETLWEGEDVRRELRHAALTAVGDAAYIYNPAGGLVRVHLRTGARRLLHARATAATFTAAPRCETPLLWPQGAAALLLWGGNAPDNLPDSMEVAGVTLISPPPLPDMWRFDLDAGKWTRLPHDGGGCPPPPRTEASVAPILPFDGAGAAFEPGTAVVIGGYSEVLPTPAIGSGGALHGYRYLADAHLYTPSDGWRRLAASGVRLPAAAQRVCAFAPDADGGQVVICSGYDNVDGCLPLSDVFALRVLRGGGIDAASVAAASRAEAGAAVLNVLRTGSTAQQLRPRLPLDDSQIRARYEHRTHRDVNWTALLDAATAVTRRDPDMQACLTWQETSFNEALAEPLYQMSMSQSSPAAPPIAVTDFLLAEPTPADCMRYILLWLVHECAGVPPPVRPGSMLFAARLGSEAVQVCTPLLALLEISPQLESWTAAASSSLMHDTNPWGYNALPRCVRCKRAAAQLRGRAKLRACGGCKLARYCSDECQRGDWAAHKDMCRFIADHRR